MRHRQKRHLRGSPDRQRKELRALATALILHEKIETTEARAKLTRSLVERLVTRGKKPGLATIRRLHRFLPMAAVRKVIEVYGPKYATRPGGYTRILRLGKFKDGTQKTRLELVK